MPPAISPPKKFHKSKTIAPPTNQNDTRNNNCPAIAPAARNSGCALHQPTTCILKHATLAAAASCPNSASPLTALNEILVRAHAEWLLAIWLSPGADRPLPAPTLPGCFHPQNRLSAFAPQFRRSSSLGDFLKAAVPAGDQNGWGAVWHLFGERTVEADLGRSVFCPGLTLRLLPIHHDETRNTSRKRQPRKLQLLGAAAAWHRLIEVAQLAPNSRDM